MIMIGDRHHDVHGAREHGIDTIGVLWGYGDAAELEDAGVSELAANTQILKELLLNSSGS
jgi:phosphoglycolate phosphatase